MRPVNTERRAALADAAIEVLAEGGIRGLTHRAVDAAAGEPDGTTSRYFRTREAMLLAVVERAKEIQVAQLDQIGAGRLDRDELVGALAGAIRNSITKERSRQLAMMALFLESSHRPVLRDELAKVAEAFRETLVRLCARAGVALTEHESSALLNFVNGSVFLGLTLGNQSDVAIREGVLRLLGPAGRA